MRHQLQFLRVVFVTIALFFGLAAIAAAQEITGSIVGRVSDTNGAAVKGATVTITDSDKKVVMRTIVTDDDGQFSAPNLTVSNYDVLIEATGCNEQLQ